MGEIGFINFQKVGQLPSEDQFEEEKKALDLADGELPQFEDLGIYKTLYGHQESCLGFEISNDSKIIASCDTLKKINVVTWPNVFNMQSVMLQHDKGIHYMCLDGSGNLVASVSEANAGTKQ